MNPKKTIFAVISVLLICCFLFGCTPGKENSGEEYTLPTLESVSGNKTGSDSASENRSQTEAEPAIDTGGAAMPDTNDGAEQNQTPGQPPAPNNPTPDAEEDSEEDLSGNNASANDPEPLSGDTLEDLEEDPDPGENTPGNTDDPEMVVESDYVFDPGAGIGVGGN